MHSLILSGFASVDAERAAPCLGGRQRAHAEHTQFMEAGPLEGPARCLNRLRFLKIAYKRSDR